MTSILKPLILLLCLLPSGLCAGKAEPSPVRVREIKLSHGRGAPEFSLKLDGKASYVVRMGPGVLTITIRGAYLPPGVKKRFRLANGGSFDVVNISQAKPSVVKITLRTNAGVICDEWLTEEDHLSITIRSGRDVRCNIFAPGPEAAGEPAAGAAKPPPAARPESRSQAAESGPAGGDALRFSAQVMSETAFRLKRPTGLSKLRNSMLLSGSGTLSESLSYKVSGRFSHDSVYDLTSRYPAQVARDQRDSADLRDAYVDLSAGNLDVRVGRQQIVWGEAVGLYIADVVNPRDLREFVLQDFEFARVPQWSLDAEYRLEDFHLEAAWVPFPEFARLGVAGSEFMFAPPVPAGALPLLADGRVPAATFRNGEYGARVSWLTDGWDLTLFGLRAWDKFPSYPRTIIPAPSGDVYRFTPEHNRLAISGATFTKDAGGVAIKGEAAYTQGKSFSVIDELNPTGTLRRDALDAMLGADQVFYEKLNANVQLIHRRIFSHEPEIFQEARTATFASLWLKTTCFGGRLEPELFLLTGINLWREKMVRPRLTFKLGGNLELSAGVDLLYGAPDGLFGQFRNSSRGWFTAKYIF